MIRKEVIGRATLFLGDCREILPSLSGFDAIVTDPPYGIGITARPSKWQRRAGHKGKAWDNQTVDDVVLALPALAPSIIWGGNYYALPPTRGWLSWFKPDAPPMMGHFELAWTSIDRTSRQISQSISATNEERVGHPTQKPLRVMKWCLGFIPDAHTILDPFMGSGTTGVAAVEGGLGFVGIEQDEKYFDIACKRIEDAQRQGDFFIGEAA